MSELNRQQLIDRKIIVDRKISEIKVMLEHDSESYQETRRHRYTPYQKRLMREELSDLKATSQRLQQAIGRLPAGQPDHILFWFHKAALAMLSREQFQELWEKAHEMKRTNRASTAVCELTA